MGNTGARYLAAICAWILLTAQAPSPAANAAFHIGGVDTSRAGAANSGDRFCAAPEKPEDCRFRYVSARDRLTDAWAADLTTADQRDMLRKIVIDNTANGITDWVSAKAAYTDWRAKAVAVGPGRGGPVYLGTTGRTTRCTTVSQSYGYYYRQHSSTTTCTSY